MRHFFLGLIVGSFLIGVLGWYVFFQKNTQAIQPAILPTQTAAAAIANNYAAKIASDQKIHVTIALSDSGAREPLSVVHDLTNLELTFASGAITLETPNATETLNITQPTIELFSLRGSGAVAELGTTILAPGTYHNLSLTLRSIKGRRSNGQIMDIPITPANQTLTIRRPFQWVTPGEMVQIVLDLNSLLSITQKNTDYTYQPHIRRMIENDQEVRI